MRPFSAAGTADTRRSVPSRARIMANQAEELFAQQVQPLLKTKCQKGVRFVQGYAARWDSSHSYHAEKRAALAGRQ